MPEPHKLSLTENMKNKLKKAQLRPMQQMQHGPPNLTINYQKNYEFIGFSSLKNRP